MADERQLPTVELRPWAVDDAATLAAVWADPVVAANTSVPKAHSVADAQRWIEGTAARWAAGTARDLVAVDTTGRVVGEVGLYAFAADGSKAEIGWWTARHSRRRGYATAAVRSMVALATEEWGVELLAATCASRNVASHRVALSAGFRHEATTAEGNLVFTYRV